MEEFQQSSPVPQKTSIKPLTFPEAISEVIKGKKITRLDWDDKAEYGLIRDGWLMIHTRGSYHQWTVSDGDLEAVDWIVVPESN